MKFSEKLKALRAEHNLTQDELAARLFVTRTAVSKWETDKGFPGIDSLKQLSKEFGVSIDELISDNDADTQRALTAKRSRTLYWVAMGFLAGSVVSAIGATFLHLRWMCFLSVACVAGYMIAALARPRIPGTVTVKKVLMPMIVSRILAGVIVAVILMIMILTMPS